MPTLDNSLVPQTCETPLVTIAALRAAIAKGGDKTGIAGNTFVSVDSRVLAWLCNDAEALNHLITRVHF